MRQDFLPAPPTSHTHITFTYNSIYSMYNAVTCTSGLSECHMHMYSPFHSFNISSSVKAGSSGEGGNRGGEGEMERGNRGGGGEDSSS